MAGSAACCPPCIEPMGGACTDGSCCDWLSLCSRSSVFPCCMYSSRVASASYCCRSCTLLSSSTCKAPKARRALTARCSAQWHRRPIAAACTPTAPVQPPAACSLAAFVATSSHSCWCSSKRVFCASLSVFRISARSPGKQCSVLLPYTGGLSFSSWVPSSRGGLGPPPLAYPHLHTACRLSAA